MLVLLVGVVLIAPPVAAAQDRTPTPSGETLWRQYPLHDSPQRTPTAAESRTASEPIAPAHDDGTPEAWAVAAGALAALVLVGAVALRRRRPSLPPRALAAPLVPVVATAMMPSRSHRPPRLTNLAERRPAKSGRGSADARPPDPRQDWTAEVRWQEKGGRMRFAAVARRPGEEAGVPVARSEPLRWPPPDADAVQRLTETVDRLAADLVAAGWAPLAPGDAWYAKRFAWTAVGAETAPPEAAPEPRTRRFERQPWPPEDTWWCEIRWHAGYVSSRFEAVAQEPGRRRGLTVLRSDAFRWMLMADLERRSAEHVKELRRMADRLISAGWERAGTGKHWYELRFVWRREEAPPEHLELAPAEAAATRPEAGGDAA